MDLPLKIFLIPSHPLTNFETQKCYQNDPRFIGVYLRDNLLKRIKDRTYRVKHVTKEIEKFIGHQNIKTNNLIMWILLH